MIRFSGRLFQNHRIRNKQVKEGYTSLVLIDSIVSYIVDFTPNGRMVGKGKNTAGKMDKKGDGKITSMINFLVQTLVQDMNCFQRKNIFFDSNRNLVYLPKGNDNFTGVHDKSNRRCKVCPRWPVQNVKEIVNSQINFNEIFLSVDSFSTLLLSWMGNGLLLLVNIVHTVMDASKCLLRSLIENQKKNIQMG